MLIMRTALVSAYSCLLSSWDLQVVGLKCPLLSGPSTSLRLPEVALGHTPGTPGDTLGENQGYSREPRIWLKSWAYLATWVTRGSSNSVKHPRNGLNS